MRTKCVKREIIRPVLNSPSGKKGKRGEKKTGRKVPVESNLNKGIHVSPRAIFDIPFEIVFKNSFLYKCIYISVFFLNLKLVRSTNFVLIYQAIWCRDACMLTLWYYNSHEIVHVIYLRHKESFFDDYEVINMAWVLSNQLWPEGFIIITCNIMITS